MIVYTFLCHIVVPDEIWALVGDEEKWQWNKQTVQLRLSHSKKFGQTPERSQWWWLSHMIVMVLPSTIQSQTIKMWLQSTTISYIQQSNKRNHIPAQVLHHLWCTKMHTAMWKDLGLGFWHSRSGNFKHLSYIPCFNLLLKPLHSSKQNKLCAYRVVQCRYQRGTVYWWHLSASRDLRWG